MDGKNVFRQRFTRIEGLSSIRRLPRLGKIRLGVKVEYGGLVTGKDGIRRRKTRPQETKYFVCPPEIKRVYGDEPTELNIMFPLNDPEALFPQAYKWYGSSKGLKCKGDGINATRLNEETNKMEEIKCPCDLLDEGKCKQRASLSFMMPGIKIGGVYQIDLSSYHSIVDINSGLDYAMAMLGGRIAMVPFILRRVPKETHNEGKKQMHYTLTLELNIPLDYAQKIREGENLFSMQKKRYEIEAPKSGDDINPAYNEEDEEEQETEEEIKAREAEEAEKEKARQEALKKEFDELSERQAKLKKEIEEGKHNLKSYKEAKAIHQEKQQEEAIKEESGLATQPQKDKIYGNVVCEKCGTRVYGFKCLKCKSTDNIHVTTKGFIHSHLLTKDDFKKDMKPVLLPDKLTKIDAMIIWDWWLDDSKNHVFGERTKRESKEKQDKPATKAEKIKQAQEIVEAPGKLEVKDKDAPYPDEEIADEDIPGSSINNAIPFEGTRKAKVTE